VASEYYDHDNSNGEEDEEDDSAGGDDSNGGCPTRHKGKEKANFIGVKGAGSP